MANTTLSRSLFYSSLLGIIFFLMGGLSVAYAEHDPTLVVTIDSCHTVSVVDAQDGGNLNVYGFTSIPPDICYKGEAYWSVKYGPFLVEHYVMHIKLKDSKTHEDLALFSARGEMDTSTHECIAQRFNEITSSAFCKKYTCRTTVSGCQFNLEIDEHDSKV